MDQSTIPGEARNRDGVIQGESVKNFIVQWHQSPWHPQKTMFFENVVLADTLTVYTEGAERGQLKESCQITGIPQAGNRLIELISYKHALLFFF